MSLRRQALNTCRLGLRMLQGSTTTSSSSITQHALSSSAWPLPGSCHWQPQSRCLRVYQQQAAQWRAGVVRGFASEPMPAQPAGRSTGRKSPITFNSMLLSLGAFLAIVAVAQNDAQKKVEGMMQRSQEVVGKAAVGGPFALVDQDGRPFTEQQLLGKFSILYFGFTHCPDICPDELEKLGTALDLIEKQTGGYQVRPVFISVDPARDTPKAVKAYIKEFHPRLIGLTGSEAAVKACSKAYRVYFHKTGDSDSDYLVDHSIIMYLIDPAGEFVTFYGKNFTAQQLADSISKHISKWNESSSGASGTDEAAAASRVKTGTAGSQEGLVQR